MRRPRLFSSSARLALWYMCGVTIGVSALLLSVYLLTQRAMERQVDLVVETEIESLREDYRSGGRKRLIDVLDKRTDDWGRLGAAYLLIDKQGTPLAGNLPAWPTMSHSVGRLARVRNHRQRAGPRGQPSGARRGGGARWQPAAGRHRRVRAPPLHPAAARDDLLGHRPDGRADCASPDGGSAAGSPRACARSPQACDSIISGDLTRRLPLGKQRR